MALYVVSFTTLMISWWFLFVHIRSNIVVGQAISCQYPVECQVDKVWVGFSPDLICTRILLVPNFRGGILWGSPFACLHACYHQIMRTRTPSSIWSCDWVSSENVFEKLHVAVACSRFAAFRWNPVSPLMRENWFNFDVDLEPTAVVPGCSYLLTKNYWDCNRWACSL